jgi:hypothetical protein
LVSDRGQTRVRLVALRAGAQLLAGWGGADVSVAGIHSSTLVREVKLRAGIRIGGAAMLAGSLAWRDHVSDRRGRYWGD